MQPACVLCRIVNRAIPAHIVFEDDQTLALLDKYPLARGHVLVIPRAHVSNLEELTVSDAQALFATLHKVVKAVHKALKTDSTSIGVNNGPASGQEITHVHLHVVPRSSGDGGGVFHSIMGRRPRVSEPEMTELAGTIRGSFSG